jgi:hypothetical protein
MHSLGKKDFIIFRQLQSMQMSNVEQLPVPGIEFTATVIQGQLITVMIPDLPEEGWRFRYGFVDLTLLLALF